VKVYAGMATCKGRKDALVEAVESLMDGERRPDKLFICPDTGALPDCFEPKWPGVEVLWASDTKGDGNKVWPLCSGVVDALDPRYIYVTVDDDLIYPSDFLVDILNGLVRHPNAVVSNHGGRITVPAANYYDSFYERFPCTSKYRTDENVHIVGTGCLAATWSTWRHRLNFTWADIHEPNMLDVWVARAAQKTKTPLWVVAHDPLLLSPHFNHERESLYYANRISPHMVKTMTWGINSMEWRLWDDDHRQGD
jgi:hypothetical protein